MPHSRTLELSSLALSPSLHVSGTRRQTPIQLVPQSTTSHLISLFPCVQEGLERDRERSPVTAESVTSFAASRKLPQCALYPVYEFTYSLFLFCNILAPLTAPQSVAAALCFVPTPCRRIALPLNGPSTQVSLNQKRLLPQEDSKPPWARSKVFAISTILQLRR